MYIFIDGSVNTQFKLGYGACLVVSDLNTSVELLKDLVTVKRFEQTSSTKLELQTLLWVLGETITLADSDKLQLTVYTDSQNIMGLPGRRIYLEHSKYFSSKNRQLKNHELYQEFYRLTSTLNCRFIKVAGHQASRKKNEIDKIFGLVDKASRRALRKDF